MQKDAEYITNERKKELEIELHELQTVTRKAILENLEYAKSLGDLSENAEYHQARDEQGRLEERISKIEHILKESRVIEHHKSSSVGVGSTVIVQKKGTATETTYQILGSEEADIAQGKLSHNSLLGQALIGKKVGQEVVVHSPKGEVHYTIISVS